MSYIYLRGGRVRVVVDESATMMRLGLPVMQIAYHLNLVGKNIDHIGVSPAACHVR